MNWYLKALKKYATFSGRARRREYWFFALFHAIVLVALVVADAAIGGSDRAIGSLSGLYLFGTVVPGFAVSVRRLHDTGRSGWWLLLGFVPLGGLVLLVIYLQDGQRGPNRYGKDPKAAPAFES